MLTNWSGGVSVLISRNKYFWKWEINITQQRATHTCFLFFLTKNRSSMCAIRNGGVGRGWLFRETCWRAWSDHIHGWLINELGRRSSIITALVIVILLLHLLFKTCKKSKNKTFSICVFCSYIKELSEIGRQADFFRDKLKNFQVCKWSIIFPYEGIQSKNKFKMSFNKQW